MNVVIDPRQQKLGLIAITTFNVVHATILANQLAKWNPRQLANSRFHSLEGFLRDACGELTPHADQVAFPEWVIMRLCTSYQTPTVKNHYIWISVQPVHAAVPVVTRSSGTGCPQFSSIVQNHLYTPKEWAHGMLAARLGDGYAQLSSVREGKQSMADDNVTVAAAIEQLRAQLEKAQEEGAGKPLRFVMNSVEVELGIIFKSEAEGGGGIKAWFLDISGKAKTGDEKTHNVKLVLQPVGRDGKPTLVSDEEHEEDKDHEDKTQRRQGRN
jgi:hypothetical protein